MFWATNERVETHCVVQRVGKGRLKIVDSKEQNIFYSQLPCLSRGVCKCRGVEVTVDYPLDMTSKRQCVMARGAAEVAQDGLDQTSRRGHEL
jgi:hypothetical protein